MGLYSDHLFFSVLLLFPVIILKWFFKELFLLWSSRILYGSIHRHLNPSRGKGAMLLNTVGERGLFLSQRVSQIKATCGKWWLGLLVQKQPSSRLPSAPRAADGAPPRVLRVGSTGELAVVISNPQALIGLWRFYSQSRSWPWQVEDGTVTGVSFPSLPVQVTHFTSAHASLTKASHTMSPPSK